MAIYGSAGLQQVIPLPAVQVRAHDTSNIIERKDLENSHEVFFFLAAL